MEIILQWFDDFEDLVFSFLLTWERFRLRYLGTGLAAALMVLAIEISEVWTPWALNFAWAALGGVGI